MRNRRTVVAALLAVAVASSAVPAAGEDHPTVGLSEISGTDCAQDGLQIQATLDMAVPAGADTESSWSVTNGSQSSSLGSVTTPASVDTFASTPYLDSLFFGGTWTAGLPFTYEVTHDVHTGGEHVYRQVVSFTCTTEGADAEITVTEWFGPEEEQPPAPAPDEDLPLVVATPRFTG